MLAKVMPKVKVHATKELSDTLFKQFTLSLRKALFKRDMGVYEVGVYMQQKNL